MPRKITAAAATHRVVCSSYTKLFTNLEAAQRWQSERDLDPRCGEPHTLEVRLGDEWVPRHLAIARAILAADLGASVETFDLPLTVAAAGWLAPTAARPEPPAHDYAVLTMDGYEADASDFCRCQPQPSAETWVRYERWSARGREAHGYLCGHRRRLTQTG
jgi:hypothetical protein